MEWGSWTFLKFNFPKSDSYKWNFELPSINQGSPFHSMKITGTAYECPVYLCMCVTLELCWLRVICLKVLNWSGMSFQKAFFLTTWCVQAFCDEISWAVVLCNRFCVLAPVVLCTFYFYHLGSQAKVAGCFKPVSARNGSLVRRTQPGFRFPGEIF